MKKLSFAFCVILLTICKIAAAQTYQSVDATTKIQSISIYNPSIYDVWGDMDAYIILEIREICDYSSVGGEKENYRIHAALFSKGQYDLIGQYARRLGDIFIPQVPAISYGYFPKWDKVEDLNKKTEGSLFSHNIFFKKHPETNVYESCDSRACPISISHTILESFQIAKQDGGYYLILGMSMNNNGKAIRWNTKDIKLALTGAETIIYMSETQFNELFK